MKAQTLIFTKGQILKCLNPIPELEQDKVWWVGVGLNILPQNFAPYVPTVLVHINGFKLGFKNLETAKIAGLIEDDSRIVLARLYAIDKAVAEEKQGVKISELSGVSIYAEILESSEKVELEEEYSCLVASIPYPQALLSYYWYLETGIYHGSVEREIYDEEPGQLLKSLNLQKK